MQDDGQWPKLEKARNRPKVQERYLFGRPQNGVPTDPSDEHLKPILSDKSVQTPPTNNGSTKMRPEPWPPRGKHAKTGVRVMRSLLLPSKSKWLLHQRQQRLLNR